MISGTSKISLNLDPINGQIWTSVPRIYGFHDTKRLQQILESLWEHPVKMFMHIWTSKNDDFGKDGHRKMRKIRLIKSSKSYV